MRFLLSIVFIITLLFIGNFATNTAKISKDAVCGEISCPNPNKALEEELSRWVEQHDKVFDMYTQCNKDLALIAEECNYNLICTDQICELPR